MPETIGTRKVFTLEEIESSPVFKEANDEDKQLIYDDWILTTNKAFKEQFGDGFSSSDFLGKMRKLGIVTGDTTMGEVTSSVLEASQEALTGESVRIEPRGQIDPSLPQVPDVPERIATERITTAPRVGAVSQEGTPPDELSLFESQINSLARDFGDTFSNDIRDQFIVEGNDVRINPEAVSLRAKKPLPSPREQAKLISAATGLNLPEQTGLSDEPVQQRPLDPFVRRAAIEIDVMIQDMRKDEIQAFSETLNGAGKAFWFPSGTPKEIEQEAKMETLANLLLDPDFRKNTKSVNEAIKFLGIEEIQTARRDAIARAGELAAISANPDIVQEFEEPIKLLEKMLPEDALEPIGQIIERVPDARLQFAMLSSLSSGFVNREKGLVETFRGLSGAFSAILPADIDLWMRSLELTAEKTIREERRDVEFEKGRIVDGRDFRENLIVNSADSLAQGLGGLPIDLLGIRGLGRVGGLKTWMAVDSSGQTLAHDGTAEEALRAGVIGGTKGFGLELALKRFGAFKPLFARAAGFSTFAGLAAASGEDRSDVIAAGVIGAALSPGSRRDLVKSGVRFKDSEIAATQALIEARLVSEAGLKQSEAPGISKAVFEKNNRIEGGNPRNEKLTPQEQRVMEVIKTTESGLGGFWKGVVNIEIANQTVRDRIKQQRAELKELPRTEKLPIVDTPKEMSDRGITFTKNAVDLVSKGGLPPLGPKNFNVERGVPPVRVEKVVPAEVPLEDADTLQRAGFTDAEIETMNQGTIDEIIVNRTPAEGHRVTPEGDIEELLITEESPEFQLRVQELVELGMENDPEARELLLEEISESRFPRPEFTPEEIDKLIDVNVKASDAEELVRLAESLPATEEFARQKREAMESAWEIRDLDKSMEFVGDRIGRFQDEGGFVDFPTLKEIRDRANFVFKDMQKMAQSAYNKAGGRFSNYLEQLRSISGNLWQSIKNYASGLFNEVKKRAGRDVEDAVGTKPGKRMPEEADIVERPRPAPRAAEVEPIVPEAAAPTPAAVVEPGVTPPAPTPATEAVEQAEAIKAEVVEDIGVAEAAREFGPVPIEQTPVVAKDDIRTTIGTSDSPLNVEADVLTENIVAQDWFTKAKDYLKSTVQFEDKFTREQIFDAQEPMSEVQLKEVEGFIQEAKPLRSQTALLQAEARKEQAADLARNFEELSGEAATFGAARILSGSLPKVGFEPIKDKITPELRDAIFRHVNTHNQLPPHTKASFTLTMLKVINHGHLPTPSELATMEVVFGPNMPSSIMDKMGKGGKIYEAAVEALGIPRSAITSYDLSASMRQGFSLFTANPKLSSQAFARQLRAFADKGYAKSLDRDMRFEFRAKEREDAGLELPSFDTKVLTEREEVFTSNLLQKFATAKLRGPARALEPLRFFSMGVEASNRAYVTMLNQQRKAVYDYWADELDIAGLTVDTPEGFNQRKQLAQMINAATGRGSLKGFTGNEFMTTIFFSPRFLVSRFENPLFQLPKALISGSGPLRRLAMRQIIAAAFGFMGLAWLLDLASEAFDLDLEMELDPRSSDFLKTRVGNTRIDMGAGYGQVIRLVSSIATDQQKSLSSGEIQGTSPSRKGAQFIRYKLAPVPSAVVSIAEGKTPAREDATFLNILRGLTVPITFQELPELVEEHGAIGLGFTIPEVLGFGVNVHGTGPGPTRERARQLRIEPIGE